MKYARRWLAFVSGVVLYGVVIVASRLATGSPVPVDLASVVGAPGSLGFAFVEAAVVAVAVFALVLGWTYFTLRLYNKGRRVFTWWCLAGLVVGFLVAFMLGVIDSAHRASAASGSLLATLLSPNEPPLWGLLNLFAAPAGLLLAGALVRRAVPAVSRRRMLRTR